MENSYFKHCVGDVKPLPGKNNRYTEKLTDEHFNEDFKKVKNVKNYIMTRHAKTRCYERNVNMDLLNDILTHGVKVWDSDSKRVIYFYRNPKCSIKEKLFVIIVEKNTIITVHRLEKYRIHRMIKKEFKGFIFYELDVDLI